MNLLPFDPSTTSATAPLSSRFTEAELKRWFRAQELQRGRGYIDAVSRLEVNEKRISAQVQGSAPAPYRVSVDFKPAPNGLINVSARCSCPVSRFCKHTAATLLAAIAAREMPSGNGVRQGVADWLSQLNTISAIQAPNIGRNRKRTHAIFYLLAHNPTRRRWTIELIKAPITPEGHLGRGGEQWFGAEKALIRPPAFVEEEDLVVLRHLLAQQRVADPSYEPGSLPLVGDHTQDILDRAIDTGRLYFKRPGPDFATSSVLMMPGNPRAGRLAWEPSEQGLHATVHGEPHFDAVIPSQPAWYVDLAMRELGPLDVALPPGMLTHLINSPPLNTEEALVVADVLRQTAPGVPLPDADAPAIRHVTSPLRAIFRVVKARRRLDSGPGGAHDPRSFHVGVVQFQYDPVTLVPGQTGNLHRLADGSRIRIRRDLEDETALLASLTDHGFDPVPTGDYLLEGFEGRVGEQIFRPDDDDLWFDFLDYTLPDLRDSGWQVELPDDFRYVTKAADEWFADIEESDNQWFSLSLGMVIDGKKYALAPFLHALLKHRSEWSDKKRLNDIPDDSMVKFTLPDGSRVEVNASRLKPLVATMIDILDAPTSAPVKVSRFDLPRIFDATNETDWRRNGAGSAWQIAERLRGSSGVTAVEPSPNFHGTLRPYQKEGLAWLQYLRANDLAGILADDMGLGKTAQTLAHLLSEKDAGRLAPISKGGDGPVLIILPTSLIFNWRREAEKFAPTLKLLSLHGTARKERFAEIPDCDVALTTYPLLWRDAEHLLPHAWHTLILDEAQTVKNAASKAAETVRTLTAKHRLCLTGTPLENHLGELWAQFDFLMPGLLGDARSFVRLWRTPIEKHADEMRRDVLARRLKPFILRRKKEEVAKELPPKSIILRTVELDGAQRDLYETVRATMDIKVRQEIASKGFARSQIVILDALLKLRQICCDPRLLKSDTAKKVKERAKLDLLMDMLPELVDEGRRVLVFSQFAGMLDLIEQELVKANLSYVRLSGETRDRETPISRFQNCEVPIFLISLKAGGVGLNLTAADTVIHYDPWWNPAAENQATDRAHRIGQTKHVFVYKLIAAGSIEEKILALQERKAALADSILSDDAAALGKFSEVDIAALLAPLPI